VLDEAQARATVTAHVADEAKATGRDLVVLDRCDRLPLGFAFYYQTRAFAETGDRNKMLIGNGPLFVDARDGALFPLGSNLAFVQHFYAAYERAFSAAPPPAAERAGLVKAEFGRFREAIRARRRVR